MMRLQKGMIFKVPRLAEFKPGHPTDEHMNLLTSQVIPGAGGVVEYTKTETKSGGWSRKVPMEVDRSVPTPLVDELASVVWEVTAASMRGGGDDWDGGWPDGWHVSAEATVGDDVYQLDFVQDGEDGANCYNTRLAVEVL